MLNFGKTTGCKLLCLGAWTDSNFFDIDSMKIWLNTVHVKKEWAHAKKETVRHEAEYQCRISPIFGHEKHLSEISGLCNRTGYYFCVDSVYAVYRPDQGYSGCLDQ